MIRPSARLAMAALAVLVMAPPAIAQKPSMPLPPPPVESQPDHPAYGDLLAAIQGSVDPETVITQTLKAARQSFLANPDFVAAEAQSPGFVDELVNSMRPVMVAQDARVKALYRPQFLALFAANLTPGEAASIARFYRSDLGRKIMTRVVDNTSLDARVASVGKEGTVSEDALGKDFTASSSAAVAQLTEADLMALERLITAEPALHKITGLQQPMIALRTRLENEPLSAQENADLEAAMSAVIARRLPSE